MSFPKCVYVDATFKYLVYEILDITFHCPVTNPKGFGEKGLHQRERVPLSLNGTGERVKNPLMERKSYGQRPYPKCKYSTNSLRSLANSKG